MGIEIYRYQKFVVLALTRVIFYIFLTFHEVLSIMFIILSYLLHIIRLLILAAVCTCCFMSGKEDKRQRSMLNYFGVQAEAGVVLPVVSTPDPQPIVELQSLHEQPPDKVESIDVTEPTSICHAAASYPYHNDIGLAVGHQLSVEDRIRYLEPWMPTYASEFPSSVRVDQQSHTKSGVERRRRLLPRHLEDFPRLAVSRVNPIPCVLFTAC